MTTHLTQKEKFFLEDLKSHEEMCIKKYTNYAQQAHDQELKQIFTTHAGQEQQHLNTINQILSGQTPSTNSTQQQGQQQNQNMQNQNQAQANTTAPAGMNNQDDATLCHDVLMTEKYVSGTYDTAIFEFKDTNIRQALNHIQKEEQKHGEDIFHYMEQHGMYQTQ